MITVTGIEQARLLLARRIGPGTVELPPRVQDRIAAIFGQPLTAEEVVRKIVQDVRDRGDEALDYYAGAIDGVKLAEFHLSRREIKAAYKQVSAELVAALSLAAKRIRDYHLMCRDRGDTGFKNEGVGRKVCALERAGIYVPGGTAAYPSTVLMTAIPARVAGVKEIIMCTPARPDGTIPPATLVAADIAGVDAVFRVGGAQAIAAMACGTRSVPKVDKICGPGNIFVMLAKRLVYGLVDIDGLQGPSEVVVAADAGANPAFCAADLLAQAEHDAMAGIVFITTSQSMADKVAAELESQTDLLERKGTVRQALDRGIVAVVRNIEQAVELINLYAPEHLSLQVRDAASLVAKIKNAGCIFVGGRSPVAIGDYLAGPSHVLPTNGSARFGSPLGVGDFLKVSSVISLDASSRKTLTRAAMMLAEAEGLTAHARALELRLKAEK